MGKTHDLINDFEQEQKLEDDGWNWNELGWYFSDIDDEFYTLSQAIEYNKVLHSDSYKKEQE